MWFGLSPISAMLQQDLTWNTLQSVSHAQLKTKTAMEIQNTRKLAMGEGIQLDQRARETFQCISCREK